MNDISIRVAHPSEMDRVRELTVASFGGVNIEEGIERRLGVLNGKDWRWRKARHIDADLAANPNAVFVAVREGQVVGYVTAVLDRPAGRGRIPNLAVDATCRGHGLGRADCAACGQ